MRIHWAVAVASCLLPALLCAQALPDRNVNMVSGVEWPGGDPFLQRQNEPSIAVSTRNPLHLLAGANDYRTVDLPGLENIKVIGDAWLGVFRSYDGGNTWTSTLMPGYPQDTSLAGLSSPLKGYPAGADPVVRAGANGLFYYAGITLSRDENPIGALFVSRYFDFNDKESSHLAEESAHSIRYVDAQIVQRGTSGQFNDKPWLAVDIPRVGSTPCQVAGEPVDGGNAYIAWTILVGGDQNIRSKLMIARTTDCGATWQSPIKLSETHAINQGASVAIDPRNGNVYVVWRRMTDGRETDALLFSRSTDFGRTFSPAQVIRSIAPFEQGTLTVRFRTTAFPSMAVDDTGRLYVAWSERNASDFGRVALITSSDGVNWSSPAFIADAGYGHQFMPFLTFARGKLNAAWYSQNEDHTTGIYTPIRDGEKHTGQYAESRRDEGHRALGLLGHVFNSFLNEIGQDGTRLLRRHTLDVYVAEADPAFVPLFSFARATSFYFGSRPAPQNNLIEQMQFNPPNLPLFRQGTVPFIGDYLDLGVAESMTKDASGWRFNTAPATARVAHLVWTDNRDVRPPLDGNWRNYTPVGPGGSSTFDGSPRPPCATGQAGMRNQNIYTARVTSGLFAGSPGNTKPFLSDSGQPLQRAFVVFVQNALKDTKTYRLSIVNQPTGGAASFLQFGLLTALDVAVPPRSSIARTVFATSSVKYDEIEVRVQEITAPAGQVVTGGLESIVVLNPDIANPDIANPDIANPDIANPDIANAEVYNPDIANPDIANPDIANPDIANPDIANPDIANPDIANPDIANPDIANPDIANPDIANPDIANPDIANGSVTDTTWEMTNNGNTVASYSVNLMLNGQVPDAFKLQLILHRIYTTPIAKPDCTLGLERHTVLAANINNPEFTAPDALATNDVTDPSEKNATIWILPGETFRITLRVVDPIRGDAITFNAAEAVTPVAVAHAVNTQDLGSPVVEPPVSLTIITTRMPDVVTGTDYDNNLQSIGGRGSKKWSTDSPPPSGLSLSQGGKLDGTAAITGDYTFVALVEDSSGSRPQTDSEKIFVRVVDPLEITTGSVPPAILDQPYSATLVSSGGVAPFTWSQASGTLPPGLALSSNGVLSGTPTSAGTFTAVIQVSDGTYPSPQVDSLELIIEVRQLSDLVVQSLTHFPLEPTVTDTILFTAVVANAGPGPAGASTLEFRVGGETSGVNAPTYPIPPLASGQTFTVTREMVLSEARGYINTATADFGAAVAELNEDNNVTTETYIVRGPRTFVVTNTADSGPGSLREAIFNSNQNTGFVDSINFSIPGVPPLTIAPLTPLPSVTDPVHLYATTQPGYNGSPLIEIDGINVPAPASGLTLVAKDTGTVVSGLALTRWADYGIRVASAGNAIISSFIGTGTGLAAKGNRRGILITGSDNHVGGNVISGNAEHGIEILSPGGSGSLVVGNLIGVDSAGSAALPNGGTGILAGARSTIGQPGAGNVISGNGVIGLWVVNCAAQTPDCGSVVQGNRIGTNAAGTSAISNGTVGVFNDASSTRIGGTANGAGNLISGNTNAGIWILPGSTSVVIEGNLVGTNATVTAALPNGGSGIDDDGTSTMIGGNLPGARNVISGNNGAGLVVGQTGTSVIGNLIGSNASGTAALGNAIGLIVSGSENVIGGLAAESRNVISGNRGGGILIAGSDNTVTGNYIGTTIAGDAPLDNGGDGIVINGVRNIIGQASGFNVIAFNRSNGIAVYPNERLNLLRFNHIHSNGALGIDLGLDGVTPNNLGDEQTVQNFPTLVQATSGAGLTTVQGTLASSPNTQFVIDLFHSPACDASGHGEGAVWFGAVTQTTDANGDLTFSTSIAVEFSGGVVTATATSPDNNTSEFSQCVAVQAR